MRNVFWIVNRLLSPIRSACANNGFKCQNVVTIPVTQKHAKTLFWCLLDMDSLLWPCLAFPFGLHLFWKLLGPPLIYGLALSLSLLFLPGVPRASWSPINNRFRPWLLLGRRGLLSSKFPLPAISLLHPRQVVLLVLGCPARATPISCQFMQIARLRPEIPEW